VSIKPWIELRTDFVLCRTCGKKIHFPTTYSVASVAHRSRSFQNIVPPAPFRTIPRCNSLINLLPNGKIKKEKLKPSSGQLDLFGYLL
jgi:hypothetical protein